MAGDITVAEVAEQADAQDSGSCGHCARGGSTPPFGRFFYSIKSVMRGKSQLRPA